MEDLISKTTFSNQLDKLNSDEKIIEFFEWFHDAEEDHQAFSFTTLFYLYPKTKKGYEDLLTSLFKDQLIKRWCKSIPANEELNIFHIKDITITGLILSSEIAVRCESEFMLDTLKGIYMKDKTLYVATSDVNTLKNTKYIKQFSEEVKNRKLCNIEIVSDTNPPDPKDCKWAFIVTKL